MNPILWLRRSFGASTIRRGVWDGNPVFIQVLGICSALAVTNLLVNTAVMCAGLIFTAVMTNVTVSLFRPLIPWRVRLMVQVTIIAGYVIIVDLVIRAFMPSISEALGPYVGLIITNCIIMGRAEAFAMKQPPVASLLDGLGCGVGYSLVLLFVAFFRELLGFGSLFGVMVMPEQFTPWTIMVMPPGAFFLLGLVMWLCRALGERTAAAG